MLRWQGEHPALPAREARQGVLAAARRRRELGREPRRRAAPRAGRGGGHRRPRCRSRGRSRSSTRSRPSRSFAAKHVVHIIFAGDLSGRSLETVTSHDAAVRGHRLFGGGRARRGRPAPADPALPAALAARRSGRVPRRPLGSLASGRRASGRRSAETRGPRPRARRRAARSTGGSPPVRCASACASSQSASHGLRGRSGPCRYVPIARPTRQPS